MFSLDQVVVTSIDAVATIYSEKSRVLNMVDRPWWGLSFCIDGSITYTHEGVDYVSDRNYAVILPKGASYRLFGSETGRFPLINFQCEGLALDKPLLIPLANPEGYLADFEVMERGMLFPNAHAKTMSILYDLFYRLSGEQMEQGILFPALRFLQTHFADPTITNGLLAKKCGISEVYFRQLFTKQLGIAPKQYILDLRLGSAKQLLSNTLLSVAEVGEACGFPNPYHFSRTFKTAAGMTPSAYRRQNKTYIV